MYFKDEQWISKKKNVGSGWQLQIIDKSHHGDTKLLSDLHSSNYIVIPYSTLWYNFFYYDILLQSSCRFCETSMQECLAFSLLSYFYTYRSNIF